MSARVRVAADEGGAVAVKMARTADERSGLRYEAELLQRCGHPGLVALVRPHDLEELLAAGELWLRYAGDPVERWRGDLRQTAGLAAAIAAILGDLHDIDVVHGRLDGSHVLVGADGRPRLCGFAPPGDLTASDDVLALGLVVGDLVDRIVPSEPRWPLWRRGDVADRRALDDVVRRASDDVAERRPSARAMAAALLAAVPGAELPTSPRPTSGFTRSHAEPAEPPTSPRPTAGFARSSGEPIEPPTSPRPDVGVTRSHDYPTEPPAPPRLASGLGQSHGEPTERLAVPPPTDPAEDRTEPLAYLLALHAGDPTEPVDEGDDGPGHDDDGAVGEPQCVDPLFGDQRSADDDDVFANRPWPAVRAGRRSPGRPSARERRPSPRSRSLARVVSTTTVAGLGAVLAGAVLLQAGRPAAPARSAASPSTPCATQASAAGAPDVVRADVDGDGCVDDVRIVDGVVQVADKRWAVAGADDSIAIGDWDCDGQATPAVYQRTTGDVFVFPAWADSSGPLEVEAAASVPGADQIGVSSVDEPCPELTVEMPTGERQTVEVPR